MPDPADPAALCEQAEELLAEGRFKEAAAVFESARAIDDDFSDAHEGLGTAQFMLGQYDSAIEHFTRVTLLDPRRSAPHVNLGAVYNRTGNYNKAVESLRKAIQLDKRSAEGYYNLGFAYRHLKQYPLAIPAYREAIRLDPKMAEAYQNLGNVYFEMNNFPQAIAQFKKSLEIRPDFERAKKGLEKAQAALTAEKQAINPLGRLVSEQQAVAAPAAEAEHHRELSEDERKFDRRELRKFAQELTAEAQEIINLLKHEAEPGLKLLLKFLTQKEAPLGGRADAFKALQDIRRKYPQLLLQLGKTVQAVRTHEAQWK